MTILEMTSQSGVLSVMGVGMVFGFLFLLVLAVSLMGKILRLKIFNKEKDLNTQTVQVNSENNANVTAAISAAVAQYKGLLQN